MKQQFEVNIEEEKINYEGEWLGKAELADKIRRMIEAQDFRIGSAGTALEYLQSSLNNARQFTVRLPPEHANTLERLAQRAGIQVSSFIRQAIQAYMAAQPPLDSPQAATPAARPEESARGVELSPPKPQPQPQSPPQTPPQPQPQPQPRPQPPATKVLVDPSLKAETQRPLDPETSADIIGDSWFKK